MPEYKQWWEFGNTADWLKQTGITTREAVFLDPPKYPYQVFFDDFSTEGPDGKPRALIEHHISVEQYQESTDRSHEEPMEALLEKEGVDYTCTRGWVATEKMYQTTFNFSIFEKRKDVSNG